jgi:hypothetical protein
MRDYPEFKTADESVLSKVSSWLLLIIGFIIGIYLTISLFVILFLFWYTLITGYLPNRA